MWFFTNSYYLYYSSPIIILWSCLDKRNWHWSTKKLSKVSHGRIILNGAFIRQKITVEFTIVHRTNKLIPLKQLTKRQIAIHTLIRFMDKEGMGYRRISNFLNRSGIKTHTKKIWSNSKVHANLKRLKEREKRIMLRDETYPTHIKNFKIK